MKPKTLETLTITEFNWSDKKKDGSICMTKGGTTKDGKVLPPKPFYMCNLTCEEYKVKMYGMSFGEKETLENIKIGDKIELIVFEEEYQERINLKFEFPTAKSANEAKLKALEIEVEKIKKSIADFKKDIQDQFTQLSNDLIIDTTGKINTSGQLKRAEANTKQVMDNMGIVYDPLWNEASDKRSMPASVYSNDAGEIDF